MYYFAAHFMNKNQNPYSACQLGSAIFMILALLWLTISIPFVYASQQKNAQENHIQNLGTLISGAEEETCNPLGSTTEEKSPNSGISFSEEFLHDHHGSDHFFLTDPLYHKCENADTYTAFHGEVQVPPPNNA